MRFIIISALLFGFSYNAFASEAEGICNNGTTGWLASYDGTYWTVHANSSQFSTSLSEAVRKACGE